jgi:hypothetical protein
LDAIRSALLHVGRKHETVVAMAISRADRRAARADQASELFGKNAAVAVDLLELVELAWHDCYDEVSPPDEVIDDIWIVSEGNLPNLVRAARLAVEDFRDLRIAADSLREIS